MIRAPIWFCRLFVRSDLGYGRESVSRSQSLVTDEMGSNRPESKDPKDLITEKIRHFFRVKFGYEFIVKIAAGNFGKVFKAIHHGEEPVANRSGLGASGRQTTVAVKMMELDKLARIVKDKFLDREIEALKTINHPNAVRIFDIMKTKDKLFVFMEFAPNGDIKGYLEKKDRALNEDLAGYWMNQILSSLKTIHDVHHMAHRDLKLENVMLGSKMEAKVADFGFAKTLSVDQYSNAVAKSSTWCGTPDYMAPQIHMTIPYDAFKADVWACGVILYGMVTLKRAFKWSTKDELITQQNSRGYRNRAEYNKLPEDCRSLIDLMLTASESRRPYIRDLVDHPWCQRNSARPNYL